MEQDTNKPTDSPATEPVEMTDAPELTLDPAQQSLADALRVSFGILKVAMLVLVVIYCFSGVYSVAPNEEAVKLRMGKMVTEQEQGTHYALPFPIEQVFKVNKAPRKLDLDDSFWYVETKGTIDARRNRSRGGGQLDPSAGSWSMLTGDANIIHAKWTVTYSVANVDKFVENVGNDKLAEEIVRAIAEQGLVNAAAQTYADDIIRGQPKTGEAMAVMNRKLNQMQTGIQVTSVSMSNFSVPLNVLAAFDQATSAESERQQMILSARQRRAKMLSETAGSHAEELLTLIRSYQDAVALGDADQVAKLDAEITEVFDNVGKRVDPENPHLEISGEASKLIVEARSYRDKVKARYATEAKQFEDLLKQPKEARAYILASLWEEAKAEILAGEVETFYLPESVPTLTINRDPDLAKERQTKQLQGRDPNDVD